MHKPHIDHTIHIDHCYADRKITGKRGAKDP